MGIEFNGSDYGNNLLQAPVFAENIAKSQLAGTEAQQAAAEEPTNVEAAKTRLGQEQTALTSSQLDLQNKQYEQPIIQGNQSWARIGAAVNSVDPNDPHAAAKVDAALQKEVDAGNETAGQFIGNYSSFLRSRLTAAADAANAETRTSALGQQPFQSALGSPTGYGPGQTPPGGAPTAPVDYNSHFASLPPAQLQALGTKLEGIKQGITAVQNSPNPVATFNSIATQLGHPEWVTNDPQQVQQHLQMLAQQVLPATQAYEAYTTSAATGLPQTQQAVKTDISGGNAFNITPQGGVSLAATPDKWTPVPYSVGPGGGSQIVDRSTGASKELPGSIQARGGAGTLDAQLGAIRKAYPGLTDEQILDKRSAMFGTSGSAKGQSAVVMGETADRLAQQDVSNGVIPAAQQAQQAAMYRQQLSSMSATPGTAGAPPGATSTAALPPAPKGWTAAQWATAQQFKANAGQPSGTQANPRAPLNKAQYDGLAKGTWYVDPNGGFFQKR